MTELALFLREAITHPHTMGALFPSSKKLANALAQQIIPSNPGLIVELGAGTELVLLQLPFYIKKNLSINLLPLNAQLN